MITVPTSAPASLDLSEAHLRAGLEPFLSAHWGRAIRVDSFRRFPTGLSWITLGFRARDGERSHELVVRLGDPAGLLAPYRAEPEYRVLRELADVAALPLPTVHAYSDDPALLGAPFLVASCMPGDAPTPWEDADGVEARSARESRSLGEDFADALGAIHAFAWRDTSLARLWPAVDARDVAVRQVHLWARHAGMDRGSPAPQMVYARRWLERHAPLADRVTIVHGDYRVGNFLQEAGRITAILDWELVHAGDPHEDLAWAGARTWAAGTDRVGGLLTPDDFHRRYATRTGFTPRPEVLRYYAVHSQFKMAAMLFGGLSQIESGRARDVRIAAMGFQLASTLLELNRLIGAWS